MKATIFSILLAILFLNLPMQGETSQLLGHIVILFTIAFLISLPIAFSAAWNPLQKAEQNITPRLIEMFSQDKLVRYLAQGLFIFPLISLAAYIVMFHSNFISPFHVFLIWFVFLGVMLDLSLALFSRVTGYLDPFKATEFITREAKEDIRLGRINMLVDSIDALSEVSLRSIDRSNTSLATQGIIEIREVGNNFLQAAKTFTHLSEGVSETGEKTDKISYTLFYLLSRLEMIGQQAATKGLEPVVSQTLTTLGRIAISSASLDLSLTAYPIIALSRTALFAIEKQLKEAGVKGEIILIEIAKTIIKDDELIYADLKSPFLTLIDNLDKIAKELFRQDKSTSVKILMQPFLQLKEIFNDPKVASHQDTPIIQLEIDKVLAEYAALEAVMMTKPPLPTIPLEG